MNKLFIYEDCVKYLKNKGYVEVEGLYTPKGGVYFENKSNKTKYCKDIVFFHNVDDMFNQLNEGILE